KYAKIAVLIAAVGVFVSWYYAPGRTGVTDQPSPSPAPTATPESSSTPILPPHPNTPIDGGSPGGSPTSAGGTVAPPPSPPLHSHASSPTIFLSCSPSATASSGPSWLIRPPWRQSSTRSAVRASSPCVWAPRRVGRFPMPSSIPISGPGFLSALQGVSIPS